MCVCVSQVTVKNLTGNTTVVNVPPSTTVAQLKGAISEKLGVPVVAQRLLFAGRQLEDDRSLHEYRFGEDVVVHLVISVSSQQVYTLVHALHA